MSESENKLSPEGEAFDILRLSNRNESKNFDVTQTKYAFAATIGAKAYFVVDADRPDSMAGIYAPGTSSNRDLQGALTSVIQKNRKTEKPISLEDMSRSIAAELKLRQEARLIELGGSHSHEAFREELSPEHREIAEAMRSNVDLKREYYHRIVGAYDQLKPEQRDEVHQTIDNASNLKTKTKLAISDMSLDLQHSTMEMKSMGLQASMMLAAADQNKTPLFNPIREETFQRIDALKGGASATNTAEEAVKAHMSYVERGSDNYNPVKEMASRIAQAHVLQMSDTRTIGGADGAKEIMSIEKWIDDARNYNGMFGDDDKYAMAGQVQRGKLDELDINDQKYIFNNVTGKDNQSIYERVNIGLAVAAASKDAIAAELEQKFSSGIKRQAQGLTAPGNAPERSIIKQETDLPMPSPKGKDIER